MTGTFNSDNATRQTIDRFNDALNRHDVDAVMALMTDDCIFENTSPFPDGQRFSGQTDVRDFWTSFGGFPRGSFRRGGDRHGRRPVRRSVEVHVEKRGRDIRPYPRDRPL